jgi:hypothetical protein
MPPILITRHLAIRKRKYTNPCKALLIRMRVVDSKSSFKLCLDYIRLWFNRLIPVGLRIGILL